MPKQNDPTKLDQTFTHKSATHEYTIPWTAFGPESAPALIFIHGTPWSSRVWVPLALSYASRFRVYLFDNPGFGEAPGRTPLATTDTNDKKLELDASLAGQAEAFAELFKSWNFPPGKLPHVIAHDNAGLISLRANILHGCEYASLCLIDVVAVRPWGSPFFRLVAKNEEVFKAIPDTVFKGSVRAYIEQASFKPLPKETMDMLCAPWGKDGKQGQDGFIRQMVQADQRDAEEVDSRYGEVGQKMPVKVIWGKEDSWIPVDRAEKLGKMIGTKDVVLLDDAGHLIMYDQPEALATEIAWWLSKVTQ